MGFIYKLVQRKRYYQCTLTQTISGVFVAQSLVFSTSIVFCKSLFVLFFLAIVLSILHRCTAFDYPFGIFKLFLHQSSIITEKIMAKAAQSQRTLQQSSTIAKTITPKQHNLGKNYHKAAQSEGKLCQNSTITEKIKIKQHNNKENYAKGQITDSSVTGIIPKSTITRILTPNQHNSRQNHV